MFETIITAIVSIIGGGGLVGLLTIKQTKASKDLDNAVRLVAEYRELLAEYKKEIDGNKQEIEEVKRKYEQCKEELIEIKAQLQMAQSMYRQADLLRCEKLNCLQRRPPLDDEALEEIAGMKGKKVVSNDKNNTESNA